MIIKFGGVDYEYDEHKIDVQTGIAIRDHTGLGLRSWEKAIDDADPVALQALYWVVLRQNGDNRPIRTLNFSTLEFYEAVCEAARRELAEKTAAKLAEMDEAEGTDPTETA